MSDVPWRDSEAGKRLTAATLLDALVSRRSRRFARGANLPYPPLAYASDAAPDSLSRAEEAALVFAACGITGPVTADLPFRAQGGVEPHGNILMQLVGRTIASGDAAHVMMLAMTNDDGTWLIRRPQELDHESVSELIAAAEERRLDDALERSRVRLSDRRTVLPPEPPATMPFNVWSTNVPGSTVFVPIAELTAITINVLLTAFSPEIAFYAVDERAGHRPAGIARHARSRGGHLNDDPDGDRMATVGWLEAWVHELAAIEQGAMHHSLGLMAAALGLGGFSFFASDPYRWPDALGFRMSHPRLSRVQVIRGLRGLAVRLLGKDRPVPTPVGLERNGTVLVRPFCPPYYSSMRDAVHAFVAQKMGKDGTLRTPTSPSPWPDPQRVLSAIPDYSDAAIAATVDYCTYIHETYGRFPGLAGPFRTVIAYQAHRIDEGFYSAYYGTGQTASELGGQDSNLD